MNEKIIDIIVPIYNVEKYIAEMITSVCKQKYKCFRVILVNDGTRDNSVQIAERILKQYDIDYIIINQENKGLSAARNAGLRKAVGKFVVFVDSDDILHPLFLQNLLEICKMENVDAAFCEYEITKTKNRYGKQNSYAGYDILNRDELLQANMLRTIKIHLCAILIKRDFLIRNSLWFNENLRYGEEVDFTWRMYPLIKNIGYIKAKWYKYLVRENSLMTNQNIDRVEILLTTMHKNLNSWLKQNENDMKRYRFVESKIYIEKIHAFAKQSTLSSFKELINRTNYKEKITQLYEFPDLKIRILSRCLYYAPWLYWWIFQLF